MAFTIPAAPKEPPTPRYAPGPGEYAPPAPRPGPAFSIAPRLTRPAAPEDIPGPGEYEAPAPPRAPAFTLAPRHTAPHTDAAAATAGPAEYDVPSAFPAGPAFSVPQARLPNDAAEPTPGVVCVAKFPVGLKLWRDLVGCFGIHAARSTRFEHITRARSKRNARGDAVSNHTQQSVVGNALFLNPLVNKAH